MAGVLLFFLGIAFFLTSFSYFTLNKKSRDVVLERLQFRRRRTSGASTPPRSLSPDKKVPEATSPDYQDVFPPSRREALADFGNKVSSKTGDQLTRTPDDFKDKAIPLEKSYKEGSSTHYTPTGFSTDEIKALGDFPDYAALSGVPLPAPHETFDLDKAVPRPYRPLRWAYHQTMSLTKMEPDWWLELDKNYVDRIKQRKELFQKHGDCVLDMLPGSELACKELMEMILQFIAARYPKHFELDPTRQVFRNHILNTTSDLANAEPLHIILDNVPEDFAIMLREPDTGLYRFRAGIICSSLGWNLKSKLGMLLHEIHAPIPDYKEKMQFSMDRYFAKKPTDKPIQRGSWGLEIDAPLYMPPGDPHEVHRSSQHADLALDRCNLRVDWQTLRRLPLSAGIVFNFKALFTPVEEFRDEAYIPSLLLKVLKDGKKSMMEYKSTWHVEHVVIPALEAWEEEQIESGVIEKDWEPHTLAESPFFPGWKEKWDRVQGF
ncbi:hypothetical protein K402DRAFT_343033 [Aulographum hederae CBS 113979]|uniref:HRQ family protein n=1 Tax=Aulographum hederae CBS 113979 TaxID=1176131 RepID=A0A6G1GJW2_9PEZI|nr:hypothetical protein K402DRAFT_343033 [Aulographum hederae CBS 113979]